MRVCAVIPIKTNNQRVPGKNTRLLHGIPLMHHAFRELKNSCLIDEVYVNTSSRDIKTQAKEWGFGVIDRPEYLNEPNAQGNDLIFQSLEYINKYDVFVLHHATNPFIKSSTLDRCIELINPPKVTSVVPVAEIYNRLWYRGKEISHKYNELIGTQFMDPVFEESGLYVFTVSSFLKERSRITKDRLFVTIPRNEAFDIDTEVDFRMAEVLYEFLHR